MREPAGAPAHAPDRRRHAGAALLAALLVLESAAGVAARADERVDLTAVDEVQLVGELGGVSGPGVVLASDATGDRRQWEGVARRLVDRGFRTLRFDYRGRGDSDGAADPGAVARDLEGAYRYMLGRKIRTVFLVGAGAGGTAALVLATRVPVAGVAAVAAPPVAGALDGAGALARLRLPVLVVGAADDALATIAAEHPAPTLTIRRIASVGSESPLPATAATFDALLELLQGAR